MRGAGMEVGAWLEFRRVGSQSKPMVPGTDKDATPANTNKKPKTPFLEAYPPISWSFLEPENRSATPVSTKSAEDDKACATIKIKTVESMVVEPVKTTATTRPK